MKQTAKISELFLILVIVLKLIDFSSPTLMDFAIMVLFVVSAALDLVLLKRGR